jgi:hypothetical protein
MKKLLSAAAASLIFVGTANAQGTWYTDYSTWLAQMTSIGGTAEYNSLVAGDLGVTSINENGVTLTNNKISNNLWGVSSDGTSGGTPFGQISSSDSSDTLTFLFNGNAFGGRFLVTDANDNYLDKLEDDEDEILTFKTSDGHEYSFTDISDEDPFTFLGYISDGTSAISLDVTAKPNFAAVDSFKFGNGANPTNPSAAVPEPGEYVSMAILGLGLCGMLVRSRRVKKS